MTTIHTAFLEFDDNHSFSEVVGPQDSHIMQLEKQLGVSISIRGNKVAITGEDPSIGKGTLQYLYAAAKKGRSIDPALIDEAIRMTTASLQLGPEEQPLDGIALATRRRVVFPQSSRQAKYIHAMQSYDLVFGVGPAGTGKTYLAVAMAVSLMLAGQVERIILSRPALEAGERLGFLPGDIREKIDPYLRPLYDALYDMLPPEQIMRKFASGEIEVAPLAFMRGRTLENAFIILDEAQNTTPGQMKMFLTRMGANSRMVITGDLTQIDLPPNILSGLKEALRILKDVEGINFSYFIEEDVVRHAMVGRIIRAYAAYKVNK